LALDERPRRNLRLKDNHCSFHALGSIVLLVTGFDSWLNEGMKFFSMINEDILELAEASTMDKYYGLIKKLEGNIPPNNDLDLVIKTRHEIVHYLPRDTPGKGPRKFIPQDLWPLNKKGLLLNYPPPPDVEIPFGQRITSYRLAYWAWETVDIAATNFVSAFSSTKCPGCSGLYETSIFKMYKSVTSPEDLDKYDALHGIKSWL